LARKPSIIFKIVNKFIDDTTKLTDRENKPKRPWYWNPLRAVFMSCAVAVATVAVKKVCQDKRLPQKEERSSMAKSKPPTGALKPAATPAATPAVVNSLL
jgi:hypothetical protein